MVDVRTSLAPLKSSSMPSLPAPEAAWYVDISTFFSPYLVAGCGVCSSVPGLISLLGRALTSRVEECAQLVSARHLASVLVGQNRGEAAWYVDISTFFSPYLFAGWCYQAWGDNISVIISVIRLDQPSG